VKITSALAAAAAIAAAGSVGILRAPIAAADEPSTTTIGSQAKLIDGNVVQGWTITGLKTSSDPIPYPVAGTLWEATATDEAIQGGATPIVSNLNARARSGQTYRALFGVATPQGVNPSTLAQGEKTTGKVYFDVTGDTPDSVVYNAGGEDVLVWVQPAARTCSSWCSLRRSHARAAPLPRVPAARPRRLRRPPPRERPQWQVAPPLRRAPRVRRFPQAPHCRPAAREHRFPQALPGHRFPQAPQEHRFPLAARARRSLPPPRWLRRDRRPEQSGVA
jgi:hypothetical protein